METLYRPTFLIMITAANNNKYYRMLPKDDGTFDVEFGRVGASCQHANYPVSQWDKKYREKVRKGYVDQTDLMFQRSCIWKIWILCWTYRNGSKYWRRLSRRSP